MRLVNPGLDLWEAEVTPTSEGRWTYAVEAWNDPIAFWRRNAGIKVPAGVDVEVMLELGAQLHERAARRVGITNGVKAVLLDAVNGLRDEDRPPMERLAAALTPEVLEVLVRNPLRELVTSSQKLPLQVDRKRALFGSWYEFFPRSEGAVVDPAGRQPPRSGTFRTAAERLPAIAGMGFDVVYLPPIYPIGRSFRKGPNNSTTAGPYDPGSPWATGTAEGGHDTLHPDLGAMEDFEYFVGRARDLGLEIALDLALQVSPDHPWVAKHPDWFTVLPDGSIATAENPPKKYQDVYPINFDKDPEGITREVLRILRHWMSHGVRAFRVDNPHTKPIGFWERVIADVNGTDPDVIFLSEAYSRPALKYALARCGFHQSYTYFTCGSTPRTCSTSTSSTAARPRSRYGRCWPPPCRPPGGSTPASSCSRTRRCGPAVRSTSTRRSTSTSRATGPRPSARDARSRRSSPASTSCGASIPRCRSCATSGSTAPTTTPSPCTPSEPRPARARTTP
jgi:starch synthase (maltosyl-transferring)